MTTTTTARPATADAPDLTADGHLLQVEGLEVTFQTYRGPVVAVRDVGFHVDPGEIVGLVGESGSGKTMSARAALGLLPAGGRVTAGAIGFGGTDIVGAGPAQLAAVRGAGMAMVFQNAKASLNPCMRIGAQIAEAHRARHGGGRGAAQEVVIDLLQRVGISRPAERAKAYPHELSGGMCQRVAIAITLACSPRLLIADEPTTGLDVTIGTEVMNLLTRIREQEGLAVLVITHDLGMVARYCDRVVVMSDGRVVETGQVRQIFDAPAEPYTAKLLSETIGSRRFRSARDGEAA